MTSTLPFELPVLSSHSVPVSTELAHTNVRGEQANRLMVIFRAPGCAYDLRAGGGCTYCGFRQFTTHGVPVTAREYITQFEYALRSHDLWRENVRQIDLFNSGNFLNDDEIPPEARIEILRQCAAQTSIRLVVFESRPEYITSERLAAIRPVIRSRSDLAAEVAIGFDAFDQSRVKEIRKGITRAAFERAVKRLGDSGIDLMTYILLKPCAMTNEEAVADVQRAAQYVHEVAAHFGVGVRLSLEPTFVVPGTYLAAEFLAGRYEPPTLQLVLEATRRIANLGLLTVGLWDEGLNPLAVPSADPEIRLRILRAIGRFNLTQDPAVLIWD
jgi:radical SAM enzyme (TIGR01210 family)